ncbi:MAG: inorganic diphosphatase [Chitinophagales bacterium]
MTQFNPWHDVPVNFNKEEAITDAIIEIPSGSRAKYELDKTTGLIRLDRVLYSSVYYPANYGFIPQTLGEDHDPLDILVLSQIALNPSCIVRAKIIGVMGMIDQGEPDDKIIAVAVDDMSVNHINFISDLPPMFSSELREFFEQYKKLEEKEVFVDKFQKKDKAIEILENAIQRYNKQIRK